MSNPCVSTFKDFNVVCVNDYRNNRDDEHDCGMRNIQGIAKVEARVVYGITFSIVHFQDWSHPISSVITGLNGSCLVLKVEFGIEWDDCLFLYTDTPSGEGGHLATPEEIRRSARLAVAKDLRSLRRIRRQDS